MPFDPNQPRDDDGQWTDGGGSSGSEGKITFGGGDMATAIRMAASDKKEFKPAETWEEAVKFAIQNNLAHEISGAGKADLETLNAVNKVLYESKNEHGVMFDKINYKKTTPSKYWIPAEHKLTFNKDGSLAETRLTIDQGHINWAKNQEGGLNGYIKKNGWLVSENMEGIVHHEYGHLITMSRFTTRQEVVKWRDEVNNVRVPISGYGKTHGIEAMAEMWSLYKTKGRNAEFFTKNEDWVQWFNKHSGSIKIK